MGSEMCIRDRLDKVKGFDECWTSLLKAKPQVYFFNLVDKGGSRVIDFPIKGIKPEGSKRIDIDKTQVDTGYSLESISVHEIRHACQHQSGCRAGLSDAEAEKEAMDWGNEYRDKAKEKKRPYTDHKRITEEDVEKWRKDKVPMPYQPINRDEDESKENNSTAPNSVDSDC